MLSFIVTEVVESREKVAEMKENKKVYLLLYYNPQE